MGIRIRPLVMIFAWACLLFAMTSCFHKNAKEAPKPMGYFRIDLPEHHYQKMDTTLPFTFERSTYSQVAIKPQKDGACWIDVSYPSMSASFKFTYVPVPRIDSLRGLMMREENMVKFHYQKADDVEYSIVRDPQAHLWGQIYDIAGKEVATPLIFWLTDSTRHFLRGTLYFDFAPNNDSLQPVIDYLREDAMHLVSTFEWK